MEHTSSFLKKSLHSVFKKSPHNRLRAGCDSGFSDVVPDMHRPGGMSLATPTTLSACQATCVRDARCDGVDFVGSAARPCTLHAHAHGTRRPLAASTGSAHYDLLARCPLYGQWRPSHDTDEATAGAE